MSTQPIKIEANQKRFAIVGIFSVVMIVVGILMAVSPEDFSWTYLGDYNLLILGITFASIFAFTAVFSFLKLSNKQSGVLLDDAGITDQIGGLAAGFIPWENITGFGVKKQLNQKFIVVFLKDPDTWLNAQTGMKKRLLQEHANTFGSPVAISTSMLKPNFEEVKRMFAEAGKGREVYFED